MLRTWAFCVWSGLAALVAQTPRDNAPMGAIGTGAISGTIVTDDVTSRPVRRAVVSLGGSGDASRAVITDDAGRFVFTRLPAGRFTVLAQKPAYIPTLYGSKRSGSGTGTTVVLGDGQRIDGIVIRLLHGAAITGRVVDENGQPIRLMLVRAMRYQVQQGERTLVNVGQTGITDDRGVYRIYGMLPGDYVCALVPVEPVEAHRVTPADVLASQAAVAGTPAPPPASIDEDPTLGYAPTYYPGTTDPAGATTITLAAGEERAGLDFSARFVRLARIDGVVTGPGITAQLAEVSILPVPAGPFGNSMWNHSIGTGFDGAFTLSSVMPGNYTLVAAVRAVTSVTPPLFATTAVAIDGRDVKNVVLTLEPGATVSGRVVFEGTTTTPPPDPQRVGVELYTVQRATGAVYGVSSAQPDADGRFTINGVAPGQYRLVARGPGASPPGSAGPWPIKAATIDGRNVFDFPFDVKLGDDISGAVITFTDKVTQLSGVLEDAAGKPAPDYFIVVFSRDKRFWTTPSRYVSGLVRPSSDGHYRVVGLPPGEYLMSAATDLQASDLEDRAILDQLAAQAITITLAEGETKVQDMRIARGGVAGGMVRSLRER